MITGILTNNKNVAHLCRALEDLGAEIIGVDYGRRHNTVRFTTRDGVKYFTRISNGPMDPMKLRNYARQSVNRAASRVEHERQIAERRA